VPDFQLALVLLGLMGDTGAMIHIQSLIDDTKCKSPGGRGNTVWAVDLVPMLPGERD